MEDTLRAGCSTGSMGRQRLGRRKYVRSWRSSNVEPGKKAREREWGISEALRAEVTWLRKRG